MSDNSEIKINIECGQKNPNPFTYEEIVEYLNKEMRNSLNANFNTESGTTVDLLIKSIANATALQLVDLHSQICMFSSTMYKTWPCPDGTTRLARPKDGEIFQLYDSNKNWQSEWMWDDTKEVWFKRSEVAKNFNGSIVYRITQGVEYIPIEINNNCQCGAKTVGSPKHSNYCPLYRNE